MFRSDYSICGWLGVQYQVNISILSPSQISFIFKTKSTASTLYPPVHCVSRVNNHHHWSNAAAMWESQAVLGTSQRILLYTGLDSMTVPHSCPSGGGGIGKITLCTRTHTHRHTHNICMHACTCTHTHTHITTISQNIQEFSSGSQRIFNRHNL